MLRNLNRLSVGFEPTFKLLDRMSRSGDLSSGYPPYNLEMISDGDDENHLYRLTLAVAGFTADRLEITLQDGVLTIQGQAKAEENRNYLHKGIAGRNFQQSFYVNPMIKITGSTLDNGMLTVDFEYEVPERLKPRRIAINTTNSMAIEPPVST
jgi:molecular chaperone IbpA